MLPCVALVLQHVAPIADRLRPAGGGRVLRADAAAHRQTLTPPRLGKVEHDADIAAVAEGPRSARSGPAAASSRLTPSASMSGRER